MVEKYKLYSGIFFVTLWIMLTFPFVSQEIIPPLTTLHVAVYLLADAVFLVMGLLTIRSRRDFLVFISFALLGAFTSFIMNGQGFVASFNGTRPYYGMLFTVPIMRWFMTGKNGDRFMHSFDKTLYIFLVIQVPCVLWLFIRYGAGDHVGGSLGNWSSGLISALIYIISFYLVSKRWDYEDYFGSIKKNYVYLLLLLPSFFNETKASFIYLLLYFILLLPVTKSFVKRLIWLLPAMLILFSAIGVLYLKVTNQEAERVLSYEFFQEYLVGEDIDELIEMAYIIEDEGIEYENSWNGILDIPRFSRLLLTPKVLRENHKSIWFGAGLGQFQGTNVIGQSAFSKRNKWLLQGSNTVAFQVFMEMGILGLIWLSITLISMFLQPSAVTNGKNIKIFIAAMELLFMIYIPSLLILYFCCPFFYILMRTHYVPADEPHQIQKDAKVI